MTTKTRRQRENGIKDVRQGLVFFALLLGLLLWYRTSSFAVGFAVFLVALVAVEVLLLLPGGIRRHRLQTSDYQRVLTMDGEEFEEYLEALFVARGYQVTPTSSGSDLGADLLIEKNGRKTAVQAKHRVQRDVGIIAVQEINAARAYYRAKDALVVTVGSFTKQAIELAKAGQVELWDGARLEQEVLARRSQPGSTPWVALFRRLRLPVAAATWATLMKQTRAGLSARVARSVAAATSAGATKPARTARPATDTEAAPVARPATAAVSPPTCPRCGSAMVEQRSARGGFWGCSRFPECPGSRSMERT